MKTIELTELQLNTAVALALGATDLRYSDTVATWWVTLDGRDRAMSSGWSMGQSFSPSTDWADGGPIIQQERITIFVGWETEQPLASIWTVDENGEGRAAFKCRGPTPLIAAMRCLVLSLLGEEVDIPKEMQY